jgi:uroporphyrinogen III methyltransferase/synthase
MAMTVYLVGAGPGDPALLTVRGAEVLRSADVVVYDRLSVARLLDLAPAAAERISVGKAPGRVDMVQTDINALLVERGLAGQAVVRLKGGDPFVFARGGEECAALQAAGVAFEVVPGISSALAVPAYAGIPVTLRHSSTSFTVVTGHEDPGHGDGTVDWEAVAKVGGTIVVLMGVARWPSISRRLLAGGLSPDTPAAAVQWGTRPEQRSVRATLATLEDQPLASPSVIVVGEVAGQNLAWFEHRPLFGRKVVVTRARAQASQLSDRLEALGAEVVEVPAIEIGDPDDGGVALRAAAQRIDGYAWVVFTSPNGVDRFFGHVPDSRVLGGVRVAAIGPGTADALAKVRIVPDLVPPRFVAEALLEAFPPPPDLPPRTRADRSPASRVRRAATPQQATVLDWSARLSARFLRRRIDVDSTPTGTPGGGRDGGRVLLARAAVARDVLPDGLRGLGWDVDVVDAYRTRSGHPGDAALTSAGQADAITFTSSSTVTNYLDVAGMERVPPIVACIGPVTAATARDHGLDVTVEASEHTIDGLVDALMSVLGSAPIGASGVRR